MRGGTRLPPVASLHIYTYIPTYLHTSLHTYSSYLHTSIPTYLYIRLLTPFTLFVFLLYIPRNIAAYCLSTYYQSFVWFFVGCRCLLDWYACRVINICYVPIQRKVIGSEEYLKQIRLVLGILILNYLAEAL